ncbi:MAG: TRAP transporter large permease subunit [Clostridia bacterium]|nr:TRAP transporter large permease subunit [Clostridia bacterium]
MPIEILYIVALLAVICVTFLLFKRPIYECMFYGYVLMVILTDQYENFFGYMLKTSTDTLFYSILAFLVLAKILDATHAVDGIVNLIVALFGRIPGGAAFTAVIGSAFMGALSGSGAGNVATTGVFTIPAMKKSGVPPHLAANIESASSTMGNMIPPSGVILAALACYNEFSGADMSQSVFWIVCWGIGLWFILQRIVTTFVFCKIYHVKPMAKEDIPNLKETFKSSWKNLVLPIIILLPFILDFFFKETFFTARLGSAGAKNLSSSLLIFTPGVAAVYALLVNKRTWNTRGLVETLKKSVTGIVPVGATIFFAYCISNLFSATDLGAKIGGYIQELNLSVVALAFLIPLICAILGMVLPGSAQTKIFGGTIISIFAAAGGNPLLAAAMLPAITGAMEGMTPPLAICMYTAMGISGSKMKETTINCLIWVFIHYILSVVCFLGLLPILGL